VIDKEAISISLRPCIYVIQAYLPMSITNAVINILQDIQIKSPNRSHPFALGLKEFPITKESLDQQ
jgi:hypothetical protein